ncbi:MAG: monovalent cation/H(+) antiporter subunit G [Gemmatimonadales bacterium]
MTDLVLDVLAWVLVGGGVFFVVVGAVGLVRMPDVYTRLHAAGMTDTVGAAGILLGLALESGLTLVTARLLLILAFLLLTSPIGTHALARAARAGRVEPYRTSEPPVA